MKEFADNNSCMTKIIEILERVETIFARNVFKIHPFYLCLNKVLHTDSKVIKSSTTNFKLELFLHFLQCFHRAVNVRDIKAEKLFL